MVPNPQNSTTPLALSPQVGNAPAVTGRSHWPLTGCETASRRVRLPVVVVAPTCNGVVAAEFRRHGPHPRSQL